MPRRGVSSLPGLLGFEVKPRMGEDAPPSAEFPPARNAPGRRPFSVPEPDRAGGAAPRLSTSAPAAGDPFKSGMNASVMHLFPAFGIRCISHSSISCLKRFPHVPTGGPPARLVSPLSPKLPHRRAPHRSPSRAAPSLRTSPFRRLRARWGRGCRSWLEAMTRGRGSPASCLPSGRGALARRGPQSQAPGTSPRATVIQPWARLGARG
jgi:hypothetical protein